MNDVRYPNIEVKITGKNGNAFNIIGLVDSALQEAGVMKAERDEFFKEATSKDYDHLLRTCMAWVRVK